MPTVLDSFVLEFGLDATKFSDEQKKLMQQMQQLINQSQKGGMEIEAAGKKMMDVFSAMRREAIVAFGGFFGGKEILETVNHFAKLETGVARFGKIIGMSARDTLALAKSFEALGMNKESGMAAMNLMNDQIMNFIGKGDIPQMLRILGISHLGKDGKPMGVQESIMAVAQNIESRPGDSRTKSWFLKQGGASDDFISFIMEGPEKIKKLFDTQKAMLPNIDADIEKLKKYNEELAKFNTAWDKLGMALTRILAGPLGRLFGTLAEDVDKSSNQESFVTIDKGSIADRVRGWFGAAGSNPAAAYGSTLSKADRMKMIKQIFGEAGVDPEIAVRVARSEGLDNPLGDRDKNGNPTSFGDFQLHYSGDPKKPALGDIFTKETGFDARDPSTVAAQYKFIAQWVKKHGWGDFHGAARVGIGRTQGIGKGGPGVTINNNVTVNDKSGDPSKTAGLTLESVQRSNLAYATGTVAQG